MATFFYTIDQSWQSLHSVSITKTGWYTTGSSSELEDSVKILVRPHSQLLFIMVHWKNNYDLPFNVLEHWNI